MGGIPMRSVRSNTAIVSSSRPRSFDDGTPAVQPAFSALVTQTEQRGPACSSARSTRRSWVAGRSATRPTSSSPRDGRMPALDREKDGAVRRELSARSSNGPFYTTEDFSYYDRCISRGVTGSILPPSLYGDRCASFSRRRKSRSVTRCCTTRGSFRSMGARRRTRKCTSTWVRRSGIGKAIRSSSKPRT